MATSFFYIYVMATSFFYIYIDIYIDIDIDIDIYIKTYIDIYINTNIDIYLTFTLHLQIYGASSRSIERNFYYFLNISFPYQVSDHIEGLNVPGTPLSIQ